MDTIIKALNDIEYQNCPLTDSAVTDLVEHYRRIITDGENTDKTVLRPSFLGKPAVEVFARHYHPEWFLGKDVITERLARLFHAGFMFELELKRWIYRRGEDFDVRIVDEQIYVDCRDVLATNHEICGTADLILECGGKRYLVDTKTASDDSFRRLTSNDIPREYVVQLALYWAALWGNGIDHVGLLVQKKSNSEVAWVELPTTTLNEGLDYVRAFLSLWDASNSWESAIENGLTAPDGVPEIYQKRQTGRLLVPPSMRYSAILDKCYSLGEEYNNYGKPTLYILSKLF